MTLRAKPDFCSTATFGLLALSLGALHCGSTATSPTEHPDSGKVAQDAGHHSPEAAPEGCTPTVAVNHVPTASSCSTTRAPGMQGDGGAATDGGLGAQCTSDSQCTSGVNGRCLPLTGGQVALPQGVGVCTYDECSSATPCASGNICVCGTEDGALGRTANTCLPSNCSSDSSCGTGGYCSPTYDTTCGPYDGIVGYYCHEAANECLVDECVNDKDCTGKDGGGGNAGYCAWNPTSSKWTCAYSVCSG